MTGGDAAAPRVRIAPPSPGDAAAYAEAERVSRDHLAAFAGTRRAFDEILAGDGPTRRTVLVHANDPAGGHGIVGRVVVNNVVRGAFQSGALGYESYVPYAGRGLMREGMALVLGLASRPEADGGLGLHRLEANIQPANVASARLVLSLGFVHEGHSREFLALSDARGRVAWRDHDRYAWVTGGTPRAPRPVWVCVGPGSVAAQGRWAEALADELALPVVDDARLEGADLSRTGAVVVVRQGVPSLPGPQVDPSEPVEPARVRGIVAAARAAATVSGR